VLLVIGKKLGGERGPGDVVEVLLELLLVLGVVDGDVVKSPKSDITSESPSSDDHLWVNFLLDELLCDAQ